MTLSRKYACKSIVALILACLILFNVLLSAITIIPVLGSPGLTLKWKTANIGAGTFVNPLAADLRPDLPGLEIVVTGVSKTNQGLTNGTVACLRGTTGEVVWQIRPGSIGDHSPFEIGDLNKDGYLEIVVTNDRSTLALHGNDGSVYWKNSAAPSYNVWPVICDVDADGYQEVFVSSGYGPYEGYDYITSLTYDGRILHQTSSWHPCYGGMSIGDTNFDGRFELYQGDRASWYNPAGDPYTGGGWGVRCLDAQTLTPLWNDSSIKCSSHAPMLADVDKDGILDVIVCDQDGGMAVYNSTSGSVLTTGGKYRKGSVGFKSHSQPTICDVDGDGNLEIIACQDDYPRIWDLYSWKLDATLPVICNDPPKVGDVTGDGNMDIIAVTGDAIYVYNMNPDDTYKVVDQVTGIGGGHRPFTIVQDVDGDGLNELVLTNQNGYVSCYDTPATAPTPRVRSNISFYSEYRLGVAEYVPLPGPQAPAILDPVPSDGATSVPLTVSQLSFNLTDFQQDLMSYTVTTSPNIGSGSGTGKTKGKYSISIAGLNYATIYTWTVTATDGTNSRTKTFTFTTEALPPWWNTAWPYRRTITVDHTKVSLDQTAFPIVIDLTDSGLAGKAQQDGDDFVFTDANQVKLSHQIEEYDSATGHLVAWVKIPFLSASVDTNVIMYYGNPTCGNQQDSTAVWDTNNMLVLHLDETHECRLWGIIADAVPHDVVLSQLITASASLKKLGGGPAGSNDDGWALVYYNSLTPVVTRGYPPAYTDPNFDVAANALADSGAWIGVGHVRARSQGGLPPWGDPHPFMRYKGGKWWAFAHNGNMNKGILRNLIGTAYLAANPPTYGANWNDDANIVDSDLYALFVLKCIEANNWDVTLGVAQAIKDLTDAGDNGAANFVMTDGETLWGFIRGNTLYYYYQSTSPQYSTIASQPPDTSQSGWVQLSAYNFVTIAKNSPPSVITDIRQKYPTPILVDSEFSSSADSADLRNNATVQDWYESRNDLPTLLYLDTSDVGGDTSKKAGFTADNTKNAYLTQEFSSPQTGIFSVQWDIYVDSILDISGTDRAGWMLIGDDFDGSSGPNQPATERFVYLAFYKNGGGTSGTMDLVAKNSTGAFTAHTVIASGLNLKQWYTIRLMCNMTAKTYDVYVDGVLKATVGSAFARTSVTHISFAQWNDGAGAFYVDNVYAPGRNRYKLATATSGNGQVTRNPGEASYLPATVVTLTATPDSGWAFSSWSGDLTGSTNPATMTVDTNKAATATFTSLGHTLTINTVGSGSVSKSPDQASYTTGTVVTLTATPAAGWSFSDWSGALTGSTNPTTITMDSDKVVTATFTQNQYTLTINVVGSGSVTKNPNKATYTYGETVTLTASANPSWLFSSWSGDLAGSISPTTITIDNNKVVTATFIQGYTLTTNIVGSGSVARSPDQASYTTGTVVTLTAVPSAGWSFSSWSGALTGSTNPTTITMDSDKVVTATFTQNQYTLTINVVGSGSVTKSPDKATYTYGETVTLAATANPGWTFGNFSCGCDNPFTMTIDGDKVVTATFIRSYTLTVGVVGSGSASKNPDQAGYTDGSVVTLTANPAVGWSFDRWSGDLTGNTNPTTITMDTDKVVTAIFTANQYTLTLNVVGSGSVTKNPNKATYTYGETVTLTASPSVGWSFFKWSGDLSGHANPATITIDSTKAATATFVQGTVCFDSTVNGNDGSLYGGVTQGISGRMDSAYGFDGTSAYIEVPHSDTLAGFTQGFTASFWLKLDDVSRRQTILNKFILTGTNQKGWFIEYQNHATFGKVLGFFASQDGNTYKEWYASFNPTAGAWYYITVVWQTGVIPKFYVNGVQVTTINTSTITSIYNNVGVPLHIGRCTYNTARYLKGSLDEIRLSNTVRSAGWTLTCYNNQKDQQAFISVGTEQSLPPAPVVSDPNPVDKATNVPVTSTELSFSLNDYQNDAMNYDVSTTPDVGAGSAIGVHDGRYSVPMSGLQYSTTYTWHVHVTDGIYEADATYAFTTAPRWLVDSEFSDSVDSAGLRTNGPDQDWYESRNDVPTLLFLDTNNVGGDASKKAGFTASSGGNAYLTQEFGAPQTGTFTAQWDIYVDSILDISQPDRAGIMLIGSDLDGQKGPSSTDAERFVFLAFYKNGGGTSGTMDLVAMSAFSTFTTVVSGLNIKQWYTIKVIVNVSAGTYDIYVDGVFKATKNACKALTSVTHISFAQWNDGAGAFYLDNVFSPTQDRYRLTVDIVGSGSVAKSPAEATYTSGTGVTLTATPSAGWYFDSWTGDVSGSTNPITITMTGDKAVIATFTQGYSLTVDIVGSGMVTKNPDQPTYTPDTVVTLTATPASGWFFNGWIGDLTGNTNPTTITMTSSKVVTATFTQNQYTLTVNTVGSGVVTKNPDQPTYTEGSLVTLTATPAVGWSFSGWSGDLNGNANPTTISMTSNKAVTATFTQNQYTLTVSVDGGGSVVKSPDQPTYTYSTIVQLTATPEPGYAFSNWAGDISGNLNPTSTTMTENKAVTAVFIWTQTNWWNTAWQYRRALTIDHLKVSSDQTDFQVLVDLTDSGLTLKAQTDGDDFVFTDTNQAKLSHEIEVYESSTGHLVAWIKIPTLSSAADTVLYLYYGNSNCPSQQDITAVWAANYAMVLHVDEKTGLHYDSTANGNNGTPFNGVLQGMPAKIDGGDSFDGVNDYVQVPHSGTLTGYNVGFTASFWINLGDVNRRTTILNKFYDANTRRGWFVEYNPTYGLGLFASSDGTTYKEWHTYSFKLTASTWYYVTVAWLPNAVPKFYVNGQQVTASGTGTVSQINSNANEPLSIGRSTYASRYLTGFLDEIRLSNVARTAGYILTCYNNQKDTSTFYQIGTEEHLEAPRYTLTINVIGQGSVTKDPNQITYTKDTVVQLTATAIPGWTFTGWSGDLTGNTNPISITMTSNKAVTATFTQDQYTLTLTVVGTGQITKSPDQATYTYDTVVTLTAVPSAGWSFTGWSGALSGNTNPTTITMTGNKEVTATFTQLEYTLTITADPSEGGSVNVNLAGPYHYGDTVELTAVPATDWFFAGWSGDLSGSTNPTSLTMDGNKAVTASFIKIGFTLNINVVGSGSVTISPEQPTYTPGSVVTLTAVHAVGWSFSGWSGDLTGTANPSTVTMDSNKSITATFTQDQYTLSITLDGNGQVTKSPDQANYTYGTIVTLTATADLGWTFSGWSGALSGTTNPTSITMDGNKAVTATFTANQYTLTVNIVGSGSVTKSPEQSTYTYNTVVTLTATPQSGWLFSQWSGDLTGSTNPATITVTGNKAVTATFIRLLVDSEFTDSVDSAALIANGAGQDWYESRNNVPTLLFLDTNDIGGNTGKKAGFTASSSGNAYLSQEFISPQTGTFSVQWDIYVDSILDISGTDATGWMMIGDDSTPSSPGPNYPTAERFVYMAFYKNGGGTSGSMELFCRQRGTDTRTTIATLNLDQWYTIRVVVNVAAGTYDVYVDGTFMGTYTSRNAKTSVTHISFAQWNDGAGAFYVDNVHSPALDRYKLTVSTVGSGSVTRIPGESTYAAGSVVTLTATPASGWSFSGWSDDLTGTDNPAVLTMNSNKNVTAHFSQTEYSLTLTVSPEDSGSVSLNQTSPYHYGDIVELTAVPTAGWAFSSWTGDLTGTLSPMVITIDANKSVIVHFTQLQYSLTVTISPEGSGSVSLNNSGPYYYGDKVELTATPEVGWNFFGWSGALSGSTNPEAITMDSDKSVTATFTQGQYSLTVTVSPVEGGSVSLNSTGPYNYGDWVELTAVPATGWSFEQWSGALSGTANPSTILIDGNKFVTAHFAQIEYSLNVTVNPEGSGSVSLNQTTPYHYGDKIELTAVPGSGWSFSQWSGDLAISDNPVVLTIDGNKSVAANFVEANRAPIIDTYNPATDPTIYEGDSQKFNATYHDEDGDTLTVQWLLNGSSVGSSNEYTFTANYSASGTYNVTFVVSDGKLSAKHEWKLTVVDVGPALLMPFDSDQSPIAIDKSGYGNNGTIYGATWVSDYGGCYFFNATKYNYIVIPDAASLDGAGTWTEITIEFWIKPTIDNKAVRLVEKRSAGNSYQIGFQTTPSPGVTGNQLYWDVWTTVGYKEIVAPFGLVTGAWSHVVCTYKNGTGMAIYVNSTVAVSASHTGNITDSTCPLNIGRYGAGNSSYFTGFMDDIRLYTKALPTSLIQKHYTETQLPHADYTLTTTTIGSGSVTVSPLMSKYPYDTTVTLTAVPSAGWSFSSWSGDLTGTANPAIITMDDDKVVTATFTANQYTLIVTVEGQGTVELVPSGGIYTYGTVVTLTATPATGWTFSGWNGDLSGNTNPTTITMDGNKAVTATFTKNPQNEYTLTVNIVGTGSVTKNPDQPTYTEGAVVTLTATPATGWTFSSWSGDYSGSTNPATITMDKSKSVTATFLQILLTDSNFDTSVDNATLRANGAGQDWYESRGQNASLLTLDTADVGGNSGKKAGLSGGTNAATDNVYLTQEFSTPQTGIFSVQWDIYVDKILDISSPDRSGWMLIGDDSVAGSGPNANNNERFVYMAFFKNGGGTSGTMDLVAVNRTGSFTSHWVIASGLNLKQWYTIKVICNIPAGTYDVYVDGILQKAGVSSRNAKTSVTHISFAQWNDGAGTFYVDNVFSPAVNTYKLEPFAIIVLPDTQFYSESYPTIFNNQTQWIVDNVEDMNILFVLHEGDLVNSDVTAQWINADGSMSLLDGHVPWAVLPGNHDGKNVGTATEDLNNYNTYFPYSRFSGETWYGDAYNSINTNSFVLFSGGYDDYIIFNFQYHPSDAVLAWANTTIAAYPDRRAIVVTHDYMNTDGTRTTEGDHIWNSFVYHHAGQIFLVLCGHMHGEARRQDAVNGNVVYQVLADYQSRANGGDGLLRILEFQPVQDTIYVKTYTPFHNTYETDADSQFALDFDMSGSVSLTSADPDLTSPSGYYRWMDVAGQTYSSDFQDSYNYSQATVHVSYNTFGESLTGKLIAQNLKPNFAYQLKLVGTPGTTDNELIGLAGRWWQEEWNGSAWTNGQNLNDKGTGSSPNPNDNTYLTRKSMADITSPTGLHYRYTGYLLFGYFITDSNGDANLYFETGNCYHVLWKTTQRARVAEDGPLKTVTFDPVLSTAYDVDYPSSTVSIFGEWERLPMGNVNLATGNYNCQIVLTEESFHGTDPLEGNWAAAMSTNTSFTLTN